MHTPKLVAALVLVGSAAPLGLREELALRDTDHKKLGKLVATYWEAKSEKKGIQAAFEKLDEAIEKTQKKIKDGGDLIAAVADWQEVFRYATLEGLDDRVKKGKVESTTSEGPVGEARYCYHVSRKYTTKKGPYALVIVVPDAGVDPVAYLDEAWNDPAMRDEAILVGLDMSGAGDDWSGEAGLYHVMNVFAVVKDEFALDYDRVFLAGAGKGFAAATATARAFPQLFAGIVAHGPVEAAEASNLRNMPSLIVDGGAGGQSFHDRVAELGFGNCQVSDGAGPAEVWAWIMEQKRDAYPKHITFAPTTSGARGAQWLRVDDFDLDEGPWIDAVADRESNTITVEADKISFVEIMLNDELVDMDAPVKVVVNGTTHEEVVPRNKRTMIDLAFDQGDWARVFTNALRFDVPSKGDG